MKDYIVTVPDDGRFYEIYTPVKNGIRELATCRNELDDEHFGCSVCGCHVRNMLFGSTYVSDGKRWYSTEKRILNYCPHCGAKVVKE